MKHISFIISITILYLTNIFKSIEKKVSPLEILGIEPNAGPEYGETRVLVRLKDFDKDLIDDYPRPKVFS
jgi:hypothetical protein